MKNLLLKFLLLSNVLFFNKFTYANDKLLLEDNATFCKSESDLNTEGEFSYRIHTEIVNENPKMYLKIYLQLLTCVQNLDGRFQFKEIDFNNNPIIEKGPHFKNVKVQKSSFQLITLLAINSSQSLVSFPLNELRSQTLLIELNPIKLKNMNELKVEAFLQWKELVIFPEHEANEYEFKFGNSFSNTLNFNN